MDLSKKIENPNLHGFELRRPSSKGTKLLLQVIKAIINESIHQLSEPPRSRRKTCAGRGSVSDPSENSVHHWVSTLEKGQRRNRDKKQRYTSLTRAFVRVWYTELTFVENRHTLRIRTIMWFTTRMSICPRKTRRFSKVRLSTLNELTFCTESWHIPYQE